MIRLTEYLKKKSNISLTLFALATVLLLGIIDLATGSEISFSIFYLLPIYFSARYAGRWQAVAVSVASATVWLLADLSAGSAYSHFMVPCWNAVMRLGVFLLVTYFVTELKELNEELEQRVEERMGILKEEILERKRIEGELLKSEAFHKEVIENAAGVPFKLIFGPSIGTGYYEYVGAGIKDLVGFSSREFTEQRFIDSVVEMIPLAPGMPADPDACRQKIIRGDLRQYKRDIRIRTASGEQKWVNDSSIPMRDERTGNVVGAFGILIDITERKRAEITLKESEAEMRAWLSAMTDVILVFDADGRYLKIVSTDPSLLYKDAKELMGRTVQEVFPKPQADLFSSYIREALRTRQPVNVEYSLTLNETETWFLGTVSPMSGNTVIWVARNITKRKHAEERLAKQQAFQRKVIDLNPNFIFAKDRGGRFTLVNQAVADAYGTTVENLLGKTDADFDANLEEVESFRRKDLEVMDSRQLKIIPEERITDASGKVRWLQTVKIPIIGEDGCANQVLGVSTDITERRQMVQLQNVLHSIVEATVRVPTLSDLFKAVHEIIMEVMPARNFYIALYDEHTDFLSFPYFVDEVDVPPLPRPSGSGLTEYVLRTGQPLLCDEKVSEELARSGEADLVGAPSPIWLGVPLIVDQKTVGVMVVQHYSDPSAYGEHEKHILEFVSSEVARAIDRKKAQEKLAESEERYRTLFGGMMDGVYRSTHDGRFLDVNQAMVKMFGYESVEEMLKVDIKEDLYFAEEDRESLFLDTGQEKIEIFRMRRKDGSEIWVEDHGRYVHDQYDNVIYHEGILRDVTERKHSEEALRASQERYRDLYENAPIGIYRTTPDGRILLANPKIVEMLGYSSLEELTARNLEKNGFEPVYFRKEFKERMEREGEVRGLESIWLKKDKTQIFIRENARVIKNSDGSVAYYDGTAEDITERKRAEAALHESEERYRRLIELSPDAIAVHSEERIVYVNSAATKLMGAKNADELIGKSLREIVHPSSWGYVKDRIRQMTVEGKDVPLIEEKFIRLDGRTIDVDVAAIPFAYQGKTAVQVVIRDITERKQLEEQLRQAQKMEGIGTLAGGIAHDFNNVLGIILAYISVLRQAKTDAAKQARSMETIEKAVQRGANLVKQLLTFARKTDIMLESMNLNELILELCSLLKETLPKTITFSTDLAKQLPIVIADHNQIHQALLNICLNSRDAMPKGGTISFKTEILAGSSLRDQFADAQEERYIRLCVTDTGEGIDEGTMDRIFEPFFTTKERGKGTGLGLAVVYGVVKSHRGYINVTSTVGKGTTFHLFFPVPASPYETVEVEQDELEDIPGGNETILLVEDEEMLLDLLKSVFEMKGYTTLTAADGQEALRIYKENKNGISLVVTDLGLPKMGGLEEFLEIQKINKNAKVIFASGYVDPQFRSDMIKTGVRDFILKPYEPNDILKKVRQALDRK